MGDDRVSDLTWLKDVTRHMRCEDGMDNFIDDLVDEFDERRKQYRALEADNKRLHTTIKRMRERIRRAALCAIDGAKAMADAAEILGGR